MKINGTYGQLNAILQEFNTFAQTYPTMYAFLYSKVRHFHLHNKKPLTELNQQVTELLAKYCEKNDKGEPKLSEQITENGAIEMPLFIDKEAETEYLKQWNAFLALPCTIYM